MIEGDEECDDGPDGSDFCSTSCELTVDPQCLEPYLELADETRSFTWTDGVEGVMHCDQVGVTNQSPDWSGPGWYRFTGRAGNRLATSAQDQYDCGTDAGGWLDGSLPSVTDGVVPGDVCFAFFDVCQYSAEIEMVNCGTFYLFNLVDTPQCALRYCGFG